MQYSVGIGWLEWEYGWGVKVVDGRRIWNAVGMLPGRWWEDLGPVPQSIGKLTNEHFPNFAGVYTPHCAINPHFLSNYECTHSVLCNLTFTLFVLPMVTVDG